MFLAIFLLLLSIVFGYPSWRLQSALPSLSWLWTTGTVILALLPVALLAGMRSGHLPRRWHRPAAWVTWMGLGCAVVLFDVVLLRDLLWAILLLVQHLTGLILSPAEASTDWIRLSAGVCPAVAVVLSAFSWYQAQRQPPVTHLTVPITNLPPDLDGLRIVHISDLHVGPTIRLPFVEAMVQAVNDLDADLICFTGDLADGTVADLASHVAPLAQLSAPLGTWFCTGNHDYYWDAAAWMAKIEDLGLHLLSNSHAVVTKGSARLVIGGLPDPAGDQGLPGDRRHTADAGAVFANAPEGPRLLLAHQPRTAVAAASTGACLTLS
ncbi:MAG: metallophosphoesterase, partial [bacterium]|nr:metallophosphoesterase [bacterium]